MPMSLKENQPSTTRNKLIIVAKTGLRIHKSARVVRAAFGSGASPLSSIRASIMRFAERERFLLWGSVSKHDLDAIAQFRLPANDNILAGAEALEHFLNAVLNASGLHCATPGDTVLDHKNFRHARKIHHGIHRNDRRRH